MKKRLLAMVLSVAMAVTMLPGTSVGAAPIAETEATTASDLGGDFSQGEGYVQYDWAEAVTTNWMQLKWPSDGTLGTLRIQYKNGKTVTGDDGTVTGDDGTVTGGDGTVTGDTPGQGTLTPDDAEWKDAVIRYIPKKAGQVVTFETITATSIRIYSSVTGDIWAPMSPLSDDNIDKMLLKLSDKEVNAGGSIDLPADTATGREITWTSSDENVITVEGATATAVAGLAKDEKATLTAKVGETVIGSLSVTVTSTSDKVDLSTITVAGYPSEFTYNGKAQMPATSLETLTVQAVSGDDVRVLVKDTDYTVTEPTDQTNAGEKEVVLTAKEGSLLCTGTVTLKYTINAKEIAEADVTLADAVTPDAEGKYEPEVTVKVVLNEGEEAVTLTKDTDYTVTYTNAADAKTGTVTVTGKGNYSGTVTKNFTIQEAEKTTLTDADVTVAEGTYTYNGKKHEPAVTVAVTVEGQEGEEATTKTLEEGTDYEVTYGDNTNAGEEAGTVTVTGIGDYAGTVEKKFAIAPKDLADAEITLADGPYIYDGEPVKPAVTAVKVLLVDGEEKVVLTTDDYDVSYKDNKPVGDAQEGTGRVLVTGKGNYTGTAQQMFNFTVAAPEKTPIADAVVVLDKVVWLETGEAIEPGVTSVTLGETVLVKDTDYTVSYADNTAPGTGKVIITAKEDSNYTGSKEVEFTIQRDLNKTVVTLSEEGNYEYTGAAINPSITSVRYGEDVVESGKDWVAVMPENKVNVGTYEMGITAATESQDYRGLYGGSKTFTFNIVAKALNVSDVTLSQTEYTYTGEAIEPTVTVKATLANGETTLVAGTDYDVAYSDNTAVGTATVTVTGKGNFKGTIEKTFEIREAAPTKVDLKDLDLASKGYPYEVEYNGEQQWPKDVGTVTVGGVELKEWTDYNCRGTFQDDGGPINAGEKTIYLTAINTSEKCTGTSPTFTYTITPKALLEAGVTLSQTEYTFTEGGKYEPTVTVKANLGWEGEKETTLVAGTDYDVAYSNNTAVGIAKVTVTGKGNFKGTIEKTFEIKEAAVTKVDLKDLDVAALGYPYEVEYNGEDQWPLRLGTLTVGGVELKEYEDYTCSGTFQANNLGPKNAGEKNVVITAKAESTKCTGTSPTLTYTIAPKALAEAGVTLSQTEYTFTEGGKYEPTVTVKANLGWEGEKETTLAAGTDYDVAYSNNTAVGTATVTVTGKGNFKGTVTKTFTIKEGTPVVTKTDLKDAVVTIGSCTYNKKPQTPTVTVKVGGKTLVKDVDYTVTYENNTNAGTAKVIIKAKDGSEYVGSIEQTFTINKAKATIKTRDIKKRIGAKDFTIGVSTNSDAKLTYKSSNTKVIKFVKGKASVRDTGEAKVTFKAAETANYKAATKTIRIKVYRPKEGTISKLVSKKSGQLTVTWQKNDIVTGYRVRISTVKNYQSRKTTKTYFVTNKNTVTKTIKNLIKGKKYYVKVGTYVKKGGKTYYSKYGKVKTVIVKK